MEVKVVDLFCGVGGLTCGLKKAGLNVVAGIDNDSTCKFAYEYNNKARFIEADISNFSQDIFNSLYDGADIKILVGCAPCQTFSSHTKKNKNRNKDKKWNLLNSFSEHINKVKPDIVSMENVPELMKFDIFKDFLKNLDRQGYKTSYQVVNCAEYGMPQRRKRLVLLASKLGKIDLITPSKKVKTLADTIKSLPPLKNGEIDKKDPLHRCAGLTDINLKRIKQSVPGGTWRDWDEELLPNCYKKASGQSYSSVYGRMRWDQPSPTMTTQFFSFGTGRFGHPEQDRALSLREGALLQTFPKKYKFFQNEENMSICVISRHIGNAVPVDLGKVIGESINNHLREIKNDG